MPGRTQEMDGGMKKYILLLLLSAVTAEMVAQTEQQDTTSTMRVGYFSDTQNHKINEDLEIDLFNIQESWVSDPEGALSTTYISGNIQ